MNEVNAVMLCTSRGRPEAARELMSTWCDYADFAKLVVIVDADDPEFMNYPAGTHGVISLLPVGPSIEPGAVARALKNPAPFPAFARGAVGRSHLNCNYLAAGLCTRCGWTDDSPRGIGPILSHVAAELCADPSLDFIGFLGDDHRPRTRGWDRTLAGCLGGRPGVAYGDDRFQRERLATACLMSAELPRLAGYMCPPGVTHLYLDNFWMLLGTTADNLKYVPEVVLEHMHPLAGKAEMDEGYRRVNSQEMNAHDYLAFNRFIEHEWPACKVRIEEGLGKEADSGIQAV